MPNVLLLFLIPLIASIVVLLAPLSPRILKRIAFALSLIPLLLLLIWNTQWVGNEINLKWLPTLFINFHLKIDGVSLIFLFLVSLIVPLSMLAVRSVSLVYPHTFFALILFLQSLLIGFFTARDLALFTIFWEGMLLPLYFMIATWGGPRRQNAALKFLIYMIAGSSLMIVAVLGLFFASGASTFDFQQLQHVSLNMPYASLVGAIFFLAFAVKTPLFPFHAWLPDTYYQASTTGTILLSALLSKAGIYGFYRIGTGFFPQLIQAWGPWLIGLAVAGVFYGAFLAWMQSDFKRLIAYSSLSHVNFILVGLFILNQEAQTGALLQAINHGITIAALFIAAGWLSDRLGSTSIGPWSGLAKYTPQLCWITLFFVLSSIALPGTNNFVGELLILFGFFKVQPWSAAFLALTVILSVIYMLRWMHKIYFGEPSPQQSSWIDISKREVAISIPIILLILWIGLYPQPLINQLNQTQTVTHGETAR